MYREKATELKVTHACIHAVLFGRDLRFLIGDLILPGNAKFKILNITQLHCAELLAICQI